MKKLKEVLEEKMWQSIEKNYTSENYRYAILDSIQFIGDTIRDKSGLNQDGQNLIGRAFGGKNPIMKLNKLRTESENNIQLGTSNILKGIYQAYRNPRSHSKIEDTEEETFEIIIFINHLYKKMVDSKGAFELEPFMKRLYDKDFVKEERYIELLIKQVPKGRLNEVAIKLYSTITNFQNINIIWAKLFHKLDSQEQENLFRIVSDELRFVDDLRRIAYISILMRSDWESLDEDARIRIENKLINIIPNCEIDDIDRTNDEAIYISWSLVVINKTVLKDNLVDILYSTLHYRNNEDSDRFIMQYFEDNFQEYDDEYLHIDFKSLLIDKLKLGNKTVYNYLSNKYPEFIESPYKEFYDECKKRIGEKDEELPF